MSLRVHNTLYEDPKILDDPKDGGTIQAVDDLQICQMVSLAASETRTLANPTKPGIRLTLYHLTDGGDILVRASEGFNAGLETEAAFLEAGDTLELISVTKTRDGSESAGVYRWQVMPVDGSTGVTVA